MTKKKSGYRESELPVLLQSMACIGLVVVVSIGAFFFLGYILDQYFRTGVAGIVVCTFLGSFLGIYWAYRKVDSVLKRLFKEKKDDSVQDSEIDDAESDTE